MALYVVNGSIEVDTVANVEAEINSFCTNPLVSATGVTISGCLPDTDLADEETRQLTATVLPIGALQTGTWTSSHPSRAFVSPTGLVTGDSGTGSVTITFTSTDGGFMATCIINRAD
jgi:uncharacterized protein YjdB